MKHYNCFDNITFEKFSRKKESSAHKTSAAHKQHWRQERKNVRENKRYSGEV
ncbi:MAG: hypothetical protein [Caudoviricetes sp.]|nr:MAG: hypothetical protein [Caudoviricetes sp.]